MPLPPPVIKIVLLLSFIIKYLLSYVTIYKSHSTSTRRLRTLMGGLRITLSKLTQLCKRGRCVRPQDSAFVGLSNFPSLSTGIMPVKNWAN